MEKNGIVVRTAEGDYEPDRTNLLGIMEVISRFSNPTPVVVRRRKRSRKVMIDMLYA